MWCKLPWAWSLSCTGFVDTPGEIAWGAPVFTSADEIRVTLDTKCDVCSRVYTGPTTLKEQLVRGWGVFCFVIFLPSNPAPAWWNVTQFFIWLMRDLKRADFLRRALGFVFWRRAIHSLPPPCDSPLLCGCLMRNGALLRFWGWEEKAFN